MKVLEILRDDFEILGSPHRDFKDIKFNSKEVQKDSLFVALVGQNSDGHSYIEEAIKNGAIAIVYEKKLYKPVNKNVTWIGVDDSKDALAWIAHKFYGSPSKKIHLIGITGTNGKTTTSYLIRAILRENEKRTGLIGTIKYFIDDKEIKALHTTPDALQFQSLLKEMYTQGIEYVVSEVSSHALALKRVDYSEFEVAVFTNLSRDHLDFHKDMEDYFHAKRRLFKELLKKDGVSVINIDDEYGIRLAKEVEGKKYLLSVQDDKGNIYVKSYKLSFLGTEMEVIIEGKEHYFKTPLIGIPNIYNSLSAIAATLSVGVSLDKIKSALSKAKAPEGRFENINEGQNFHVFIDYAHTPDALDRLLKSVIRLKDEMSHKGRIITIFGCGGNRDKGKRPQMGRIATELSDYVIITSDNPRWEEPRQIIRDIEDGIVKDNFMVVSDRRDALKIGVSMCEKDDILIVAGKGHEDYQEIKGVRLPFSDKEILKNILKELKK